jgi:membrane protease YdiL (CAAX protease family)
VTLDDPVAVAGRPRWRDGAEAAAAALAFTFVAAALFSGPLRHATDAAGVALLFALLVGGYLALSVGAAVRALQAAVRRERLRALAVPAVLWVSVLVYCATAGLPVASRALVYGVYLTAPALPLLLGAPAPPGRAPVRELAAIVLLWLPIELRLLPPVPIPPGPGGHDISRFVGLVEGLYLFLVVRPVPGIGYTFLLRWREVGLAVAVFVAYSVVALPVGLGTGFLRWHPNATTADVVTRPLLIYLATGVPEEFLFRGLIQNLLARWWGADRALPVTAVVFGLAHLPDPRYVLLATLAGLAYGWVYQRTSRITASAVTHALVDAAWVTLLRR